MIEEGAGAVASDSLAAESTSDGGKFSENRNSESRGVKGANSTFANTNTSGAIRLDPASDSEARMAQEDWEEERKLGAGSTSYPAAGDAQSKDLDAQNTERSYETGGSSNNGGIAPSYVNSQAAPGGPKGKNLTEGGFESNDKKNASFTSDIGTKNDPGRLAEEKYQMANADAAESAGMPRQEGGIGDNTYTALDRNTKA